MVQKTISEKAGTTLDQPVTAERLEYLIIDKPIAETVLFTGVIFRSLNLIPGLTAGGRLAAHLFSANFFAEWQADRPNYTPVSGWFKEDGGVDDMGVYTFSFLQALTMQYLFTTTSTTLLGLARPIGWSVFLYALMALNETKDALTSSFTRIDNIPLYNSAVKAIVKNFQVEYHRLSRQPSSNTDLGDAISRAATHCTLYVLATGTYSPLIVTEAGVDNDDETREGENDRLAQSLIVERSYKQSIQRV